MSLSQILKSEFGSTDRNRGSQYFRDGDVSELNVTDGLLVAEVDGSWDSYYEVTVDVEDVENVDALSCTCPRFANGYNCKHIWAAILAFDSNVTGKISRPDSIGVSKKGTSTAAKKHKTPKRAKRPEWQRLLQNVLASANDQVSDRPSLFDSVTDRQMEIYYVIDAASGSPHEDVVLILNVMHRVQKKDGSWGQLKSLKLEHGMESSLANTTDRRIVAALLGADREYGDSNGYNYHSVNTSFSEFEVSPDWPPELSNALCESGRLHWTLDDRAAIDDMQTIKSIEFEIPADIQIDIENISQSKTISQMSVAVVHEGSVIDDQSIVQIDESGVCLLTEGLIRINDIEAVELWRHAQSVDRVEIKKSERVQFLKLLSETPGLPTVRFPDDWQIHETEISQPRGMLKLENTAYDERDLAGTVSFLYGDTERSLASTQTVIFDEATNQWTQRDEVFEATLLSDLLAFPILDMTDDRFSDCDFKVHKKNLLSMVDELGSKGWRIELWGKPIKQAGSFDIQVESGQDWFDLSANVSFDGETISLPSLLQAVTRKENFITLADGSKGRMPDSMIEKYSMFSKFGQVEDDKIRFRPAQAMLLDAMLESQPQVHLDRGFRAFRKKLKSFTGVKPKAAPKSFQGDLRTYQTEGLGWLHFLREFNFGGCLADDMGLGKTIQVLALLESRRTRRVTNLDSVAAAAQNNKSKTTSKSKTENEHTIAVAAAKSRRRPSIVVVPKSLIFNWIDEASRFTPKLRFLNFTGTDRKTRAADCEGFDVLITTYGTMRKDIEALASIKFDYAILDESQAIKNSKALCAKSSRLLQADYRLAMTGTPIENHLGELWSLFEFLNPGMLGQSTNFARLTNQKKNNEADREETLNSLSKAIQPFMLRRTKEQVLTDLPPKTEQTLTCEMLPAQKKKYDELKEYYRVKLAKKIDTVGIGRSKIQVLEALLRLRQVACDPRLLDKSAKPGAKLDLLGQQIGDIVSEGHKVLVFSQFTQLLGLVKDQFDDAGITYEYLDGKTSKRAECVKRFQNDASVSAFLISLKAGGHGLNLTAADYVFLLDPWWNPAVEAQAIDRAHRMGQQNPVIAYRMICQGTVEEKIVALQETKRKLADSVISSDESLIRSLTADDLQLLLA